MAPEPIRFAVENQTVDLNFEIQSIRRGGVLHVELGGGTPIIRAEPSESSSPYKIVWVTTRRPEGYRLVSLLRELWIQPALAGRLIDATGGQLALDQVNTAIAAAARDVPFERLHDASARQNSRLQRIEDVLDRLDLVATLNRPNVGEALWHHHGSLTAYLLLTCFDVLGQGPGGCDFATWLNSNEPDIRTHRDDVERGASGTPVETARALLSAFNERYASGRSFRRFVTELLPEDARQMLMSSIRIERRVSAPLNGELNPPTSLGDTEKISWLYRVRNKYTHNANFESGFHEVLIPEDMRDDGSWWGCGHVVTAERVTNYDVRGWLGALNASVRAGLLAYVRALAALT